VDIGSLCWARKTRNSCRSWSIRFTTFPPDNQRTSPWCSSLIAFPSMYLHTTENIPCFFEYEQMKFTIDMTSSETICRPDRWLLYFLNYKCFSMNQAVSWNTVKENVFDFSDNSISRTLHGCCSISRTLHGCCSIGSKWLTLRPKQNMFLNKLIEFGEDGSSSCANSRF